MNTIKSFRDLIVWQKAMLLVKMTYPIIAKLPPKEQYCLYRQIQRCVVSIPSNIAEGYGRQSKQDYIRFLHIAKGSLFEFQTQLELSKELGYIDEASCTRLTALSNEVDKILYAIIKKLSLQNT